VSANAFASIATEATGSIAGLTSVIVVAADSGPSLLECVTDVLASTSPVELLLSDNDSRDGSVDAVVERFSAEPRLHILRNGKNLGFGAGANRAVRQARGDAILLLNPDCRLGATAIARLRDVAATQARLGVLGLRIVDANGTAESAARRNDPTLRRALNTLLRRDADGQGVNLPPREGPATEGASVERVDAVSGAAMWLPRAVYERLRGFDEGYFLHCEDLDLCRRARDAGFSVIYTEAVEAVHSKGGSSRHRPVFVAWHKHRGMWRWFRQHDPAARNPLLAAVVWGGLWTHFVLTMPGRWLQGRRAARAH
jgi:GT2 family glycosyltransferase